MSSNSVAQEGQSPVTYFTPESPFLETPNFPVTEAEHTQFEDRFWETESPFLRDAYGFEAPSPLEAEFRDLLAEMNDESFNEIVREMAAEAVVQNLPQLNTEFPDRESTTAHAERVLNDHFAPLAEHAEVMLDRFAQSLDRYDVQSLTTAEIDRIAEQYQPIPSQLNPTFEEFLGKLFSKAKKIAKGAVNLAKKGIATLGKLGLGPLISRLKKFVWPLLKRVIQMALNRIPAPVRPLAQKLASKLLGTREAETFETETGMNLPATMTGEHIQLEADVQAVQLLFASDETEMEQFTAESVVQTQQYEDPAGDLHRARERLIGELSQLQQGQDATPAIEHFLPAALMALQPLAKVAIKIVGRPNVVNLLARLLAKLLQPHLGAEGAQKLSQAVANVGLGLIGLEVSDQNIPRLGYETIATTLEQTVTGLATKPEHLFEDQNLLEAAALQSFEVAIQSNIPQQFLKPQIRPTNQGIFVPMPRHTKRKYYKKYSQVLPVDIPWPIAEKVKTYGMFTLADFFRDQLLIPAGTTVRANAHIYEAVCGTWLGYISQMEKNIPGLGGYSRQAYFQFHPLTEQVAMDLFRDPKLGKDVDPVYLAGREALAIDQRIYYLEIPGPQRGLAASASSYVRIEIDLKKGEIRVYIYLNERTSQEIAQQLRTSGVVAGAMQAIAGLVGAFISTVRGGRGGKAVKVIRETLEPEQLSIPNVGDVVQGARSAASAIGGAVRGAIGAATGAATTASRSLAPGLAGSSISLASPLGGGFGTGPVGAAQGKVGGAIGAAALEWIISKVLDWANQALGSWLATNKEQFIRQASDPSKKGVTIISTFNPSQDTLRRLLLTVFVPSSALLPSRVELMAGPR